MDFTNKIDKNAAFNAFGKIDDTKPEPKTEEKPEVKAEVKAEEKVEEMALETVTEAEKPVAPVQEKSSSLAEGLPAWDLVPPMSVIGRR